MIIVTGGAGFIGSNIINALNTMGYNDILVVDNLTNGIKYANIADLTISDYIDKDQFITSISDGNKFNNIEVVFHEGACSSTTNWNGKYIMNNNYQYSKDLLYFCVKKKIPFLYASSAAVYGNKTKYFIENREYEHPLNIYSYSKFLFDQYVRTLLSKTKSQICGFRYFNVYGPRENHKGDMASVPFNINNQIKNRKTPKLFIDSHNLKRDFIYISDVVEVNIWFWRNKISGIFNCGTGIAESFQVIADNVLNFHKKSQLEYIPIPEQLKKHYQSYTKADLTKLRNAGYTYRFKTIKEGIKEYLLWLN